jgi:O-acetyl-ADP-ribose deacetylase (regulator of RNase III)
MRSNVMKGSLTVLKGDATAPQAKGNKIIVHVCNDIGGWGKGFVLAISKRWSEPEKAYRKWHRDKKNFKLGEVQFVVVSQYITVANMIGQRGIKTGSSGVPIRYEAVAEGLAKVAEKAIEIDASVHMPRIGCGLAGGKWEKIEPIIIDNLINQGIDVFVYDY